MVPTRLDGPRSALWGQGDLSWSACSPVVLGPGAVHEVVVRGDEALRPATVRLSHVGSSGPKGSTTPVTVTAESATHLTGTVAEGAQRLLALTLNHNPGWEATLGGTKLAPIVVDGFRQGFVLPDGAAGTLDVVFAPDQAYRAALVVGLLLAVLLIVALVVPERGRSVTPAADDRTRAPRPTVAAAVAVAFALVVAGPWAALTAGCAVGGLGLRRTAVLGTSSGHRRRPGHRRRGAGCPDPPRGAHALLGGGDGDRHGHRGRGARRCGTVRAAQRMAGRSTATWLSHARSRLIGSPSASSGRMPPVNTSTPVTA